LAVGGALSNPLAFLPPDSEAGRLIAFLDASRTPLGRAETWPQSLKAAVGLMLPARAQIVLFWGPDYIALYNDAYVPTIGGKHPHALGRPAVEHWRELWDDLEPLLRHVRETGRTVEAKDRPFYIERHGYGEEVFFDISYSPVPDEGGGVGGVLCIISETTERMRTLRHLQESEALLRFTGELDEALRGSSDAPAAMHAAAELLAKRLGASRCAYAAVDADNDSFVIHDDYTAPGLASSAGAYSLDLFGPRAAADMRAGRTLVIRDVSGELASGEGREMFQAIGIEAIVCCPLVKEGRLVAMMAVHQDRPRDWQRREIALVETVVERCWAHVERVGAEARLRDSEARFRAVFDQASAGFARTDLDGRFLEVNDRYCALVGRPREQLLGLRMQDITSPDDLAANLPLFLAAADGGPSFEIEKRYVRPDGSAVYVRNSVSALSERHGARSILAVSVDISDRKRAEAALRESEARFRNMADHAPVMVWTTDQDGACTYLNRAWYEFTGQSEAEALGFGWLEATHPDDKAAAERTFVEANARRRPFRLEYRLRRRDGTYRWAIDAAAPRFGLDGKFEGYVGSVLDIDELREAEARLRTLTNVVPAFVWFATPDGQLHYFNDRWYEYTGQTPETALPDGWVATLHPDDVQRTAVTWAEARARGVTYEIEVRYRRSDGAYRWYLARAEPLRGADSSIASWFGTSTDIHDRRLAEERLRELNETLERRVVERTGELAESERRFRGIFDSALQFMALLTPDGIVVEVNRTALRWSEIEPADIVGRPFWQAAPMRGNPALQAAIAAGIRRAAAGETVREEHEMRGAGEVRAIVDFSLKPVPGPDGRAVWLVAEGRDITELKFAQDALRQAQKLEAVGQLTGGVAHDFNNLLTIIRSSTDLLRKPGLAEERRRRYVDAITETVDRASKLTGQLLAFARRQALKPEVFDPSERIRSILEMLRTVAGSRVELETEFAADGSFVEADASQFETALVNMVANARDAMGQAGRLAIRVRSEAAMPPIRGHGGGPGPFLAVSISDTGIGIPADRLGQIFEPFYTTKEVGKGTGLGLSQVYGFAKQSGGDIAVESEVGRGTTFTLYLRRASAEAAARVASAGKTSAFLTEDGRGRRVLVVEDNVDVGRFSTQVLQDLGYETAWATNAEEALQLLSEVDGFDVVFSDVVMPGMSGVELGREIRQRYPGLPVVLTSGYSHVLAEEGRHGFELLQKPYAAEELSRVLRRVTRTGQAPAGL
jgi:PAS domain S-box-containing protein